MTQASFFVYPNKTLHKNVLECETKIVYENLTWAVYMGTASYSWRRTIWSQCPYFHSRSTHSEIYFYTTTVGIFKVCVFWWKEKQKMIPNVDYHGCNVYQSNLLMYWFRNAKIIGTLGWSLVEEASNERRFLSYRLNRWMYKC